MPPLFLRRRDTADVCAVSETVVLQWERAGLLRPIKLPGLRAVRHARADVEELARKIGAGEVLGVTRTRKRPHGGKPAGVHKGHDDAGNDAGDFTHR